MEQRQSSIIGGLVLVLVGSWFLISQYVPGFDGQGWPFIVIGVGVALLLSALFTGISALAIPACVVSGIGSILLYQNITDDWESWAYMWALIPGFVGVGQILCGFLGGKPLQEAVSTSSRIIGFSLVLFLIFGSFLGNWGTKPYWPILLIVLGFVLVIWPMVRSRSAQ
jgi:hypothetical protein